MIISGIYTIKNIVNSKIYVGSTKNFKKRWDRHIKELKLGEHKNQFLKYSWKKYGESSFEFHIIEEVSDLSKLIEREQYWMDTLNPEFNICRVAGSSLGTKHSMETRLKMSILKKGIKKKNPVSEETKQKISNTLKGTRHSEESYKRAADKMIGKVTWNIGRKASAEKIRKLRESHLGQRAWNKGISFDAIKGENHHNSKFINSDILNIREMHSQGKSFTQIGKMYNVYCGTISRIVKKQLWSHI